MIRRSLTSILVLAAFIQPVPVWAEPSQPERDAVRQAEERGALLHSFDQAAWHATDAFQADLARQSIGPQSLQALGLRGYIVEPAENGELLTSFFGGQGGKTFAYARYWTLGGQVVRGGILTGIETGDLSPLALRLISARDSAINEAVSDKIAFCGQTPANTIVLPPDPNGVVSVYLLSSTNQNGLYPGGGHYRFDLAANGTLLTKRQFMKSCFDFDSRPRNGQTPEAVFVTHLLDPQPTEIHVFASYYVPIPIGVITVSNKEVWQVSNGKVVFAGPVKE